MSLPDTILAIFCVGAQVAILVYIVRSALERR